MGKRRLKELSDGLILLKIFNSASPEEKQVLLKYINHDGCEPFIDCIHNGLTNDTLSVETRKEIQERLGKNKRKFRYLINCGDENKAKRQKTLQQVGGDASWIVEKLLPLLSQYLEH